jgi:serpin B
MPYKGKGLSMLIFLPGKHDGLPELESTLTADNVWTWIGKMADANVIVTLPKFKSTAEFKLIPALEKLGMTEPFGRSADFSGMSTSEGLSISNVIHKAFVEVNEEGAEAAGATGVIAKETAKPVVKLTPVFRANHPFLFLIRDNRSGSILFLGRMENPSK